MQSRSKVEVDFKLQYKNVISIAIVASWWDSVVFRKWIVFCHYTGATIFKWD